MCYKGNTPPVLVEVKVCTATLEINMEVFRILGLDLAQDLAVPPLGIFSKDVLPYHVTLAQSHSQ